MMNALISGLVVIGALSYGAPAAHAEKAGERACFDLAVIASAPTYRWMPVSAGPDEIIIRAPVQVTFDVEEVLAGASEPETVTVDMSLHTGFNDKIQFLLLLLKRQPSGHYREVELLYRVVRQFDGEFVWPLAAPLLLEENGGLIPANYETLLKPVRYRAEDAWWLRAPYATQMGDAPLTASDYPWGAVQNGGSVIAARGLRMRDLIKATTLPKCSTSGERQGR